ncbi:MAG: hypothetical protein MMC33_000818 [Icmadophila ericetorum]|nr:hypothetical protein [Icmadophila ericetorum]
MATVAPSYQFRSFSSTYAANDNESGGPAPYFARQQESREVELGKRLDALLASEAASGLEDGDGEKEARRWKLVGEGVAVEKMWRFGSFGIAREFMNEIFEKASKERHHPELINTYNKVLLRWTTHQLPPTQDAGLSWKDLNMAEFCDKVGSRLVEKGKKEKRAKLEKAKEKGQEG